MTEEQMIGTVMIVDDEELDQKLYRRVLERSGAVGSVIGFTYADKALEYFEQPDHPAIDVLFLDINMPRMNGFEFLEAAIEKFGNEFAKIIVVMLTTSLDPADEERARRFSMVKDFINKPLLREHVKRVCTLLG